MKNNRRLLFFSIALFLLSILLSLLVGAVKVDILSLLRGALSGPNSRDGYIFYYSRLPRTIASLSAGFALSLSGAILQSVLGNSLAAPGIIGVNSGAGLAVALVASFGVVSGIAISLSSFLGALLSTILVVILSRRIKASRSTVLLAGVALNYIFGALTDVVSTLSSQASFLGSEFKVGGFSSLSSLRLYPALAVIIVASTLTFTLSLDLQVLSLGEDEAKALGMKTGKMRVMFVVLSSLLAGAAVSFSGLLGFVGLIVPNAVRRLTKGKEELFLPLSALLGASFVTLCDVLSRIVFSPYEVPVGIILAIVGGPVFLYLVIRRRK